MTYDFESEPVKGRYGSVTAMLTGTDVNAAAAFYQKAFGFAKRGIMNGPDGKPIHAELTLRGTTLMLGWNGCRSRGLHLDGRYPHCTTHT